VVVDSAEDEIPELYGADPVELKIVDELLAGNDDMLLENGELDVIEIPLDDVPVGSADDDEFPGPG
jgi:hypothetical protein